MKADIKERWVEALCSGNYEQTTGQLYWKHSSGLERYCCLGVLLIVLGAEKKHLENGSSCLVYKEKELHAVLRNRDVAELGLSDFELANFVERNDTGWSFYEIAREIERNY